MAARRTRRSYDHRFRDFVRETGDVELAVRNGVPRSTARERSRFASPKIISLDVASMSQQELRREVLDLRKRHERLLAILRLLVVLVKISEVTLRGRRVPEGVNKRLLLRAVDRSKEVLSLRAALNILGLSKTRYHDWKREEECELEDASSCPQSRPQQLTAEEREVIRDMVTSSEYRHVPTGTLAILAQRTGKVFASPSTWHRLARKNGWRRSRKRVHPEKPRLGIRASSPVEIWHVDTTVVRLLNGSHAYLYAVIDNFSRRILSWRVSERCDPTNTIAVLTEAGSGARSAETPPTLLADAGLENRTRAVDALVDAGALKRLYAMTDITSSNSIIEAWWRSVKHQWLFLNELDSVGSVRRLVEFYAEKHNAELPHSAFRGQTPDEMYFGTGDGVPDELETKRATARAARITTNRSRSCRVCRNEAEE